MKNLFYLLAALIICITAITDSVQAYSNIWADQVFWSGERVDGNTRTYTENALGEINGNFLSIGNNGIAIFSFEFEFDTAAFVFEVTWGTRTNYLETANVYVADSTLVTPSNWDTFNLKNYMFVQKITNQDVEGTSSISLTGGPYTYLIIEGLTSPGDGFDIDAITANPTSAPVPEPATMLLFGLGLVGLAGIRIKNSNNNKFMPN